jgi:hypothetical protein
LLGDRGDSICSSGVDPAGIRICFANAWDARFRADKSLICLVTAGDSICSSGVDPAGITSHMAK